MSDTPHTLFFACPVVRWPKRLPGPLIEQGRCRVVEEDVELVEYLLGQNSFPEAFATEEARDHALGMASEFIEFVPTSWGEAQTAGFDVGRIAIGHALGESGFETVAAVVLSTNPSKLPDFKNPADRIEHLSPVIIQRVAYHVHAQRDGNLSVSAESLYKRCDGHLVMATAAWLTERLRPERSEQSVFR